MKSFIIKDGIQISCELSGESWRQGDTISGTLEVGENSKENRVILATGTKKKILTKNAKAFTIIKELKFNNTDASDFKIKLAQDCSVETSFILFGPGEDLFSLGLLELKLEPAKVIVDFLDVFNNFYKFKTKSYKSNKKGFIEAKVNVPSSVDYSNVVSLKLLLKMMESNLILSYQFIVNKVNYVDGDAKLEQVGSNFDVILTPKDYLIYGDSFNQEKIKEGIEEVLTQVKKKQF